MSDIFLTCSLDSLWQIESIADFIILVMLPWLLYACEQFSDLVIYTDMPLGKFRSQIVLVQNFAWTLISSFINNFYLHPGKKWFSHTQRHLQTQMAWNEKLFPNPKCLNSPLAEFKIILAPAKFVSEIYVMQKIIHIGLCF